MKIVQKVPNCFTLGYDPMKAEVSTLEEFYALPYIKSWMKVEKFCQFSKDRAHKPQALLVCEAVGMEWFIAYLTEHEDFDLPLHGK